jgi:predicted dehydrogenase
MARTYDAVVIGAGSGGTLSITALMNSERYNLVAVADPSPAAQQRLKADYPGLRLFDNHQALFEAVSPQVVCVSTWATSHLAITRDALKLPSAAYWWKSRWRIISPMRARSLAN